MGIDTLLPQVTAQFGKTLRARALATRLVSRDMDPAPANRGDAINIRYAVAQTPEEVTPGHTPTAAQESKTITTALKLDQWFKRSMVLTDKELGEIESGNVPQQVEQMAIDLAEFINVSIYRAVRQGAGAAVGTAGTNPFAAGDGTFLDALMYLERMKAPEQGRVGLLNLAAWRSALGVANFVDAAKRGGASRPLVTGEFDNVYGAAIDRDQLLPTHTTAALGAGALTVSGVNAVKLGGEDATNVQTVAIAKAAGASCAVVAGDVLFIAGHAEGYVVKEAVTVVHTATTTVKLNRPLEMATVGGEAVTLAGAGTAGKWSPVFHATGVMFATRPLADLSGAANTYTFQDDKTGITIRAELTRQESQSKLTFDALWGTKVIRPELVAMMLG